MVNFKFWERWRDPRRKAERVLKSKVQKGITLLATEHAALLKLQEDLRQLQEDIQKRMREKGLRDVQRALRDLRFLGRAENRLEPTEEEIRKVLEKFKEKVKVPSGTYEQVVKHIEEVTRDLEVEAGKVLTAASRYEGKIHDLLERLALEVEEGNETKALETIEEVEKLIAEIDQKWIPALAADFKRAEKIEKEFVRTSGAEEQANAALRAEDYTEAAKLFWQANKPKKVISALEKKRTLTPEDEELLLRACVAAQDAERAGNVAIKLDQAAISRLITEKEVGKLGKHLEDHVVKIYLRCGDKLLKAWERLLSRIEQAPFDKLKRTEKEWILGLINQKLLRWEIAAKHYENAGDLAAAVLCWAKTGNKAQLERVKALLVEQRRQR